METIEQINKMLVEKYGSTLDGRAKYRMVFANDEVEKRLVNHEVIIVKKYDDWLYWDRYILEHLEFGINLELCASTNGHYEPIWVFRGPGDTFQKPIWKGVDFMVRMHLRRKEPKDKRITESERKELSRKYIAEVMEALGGDSSVITSMLHTGDAVVVPQNFTKEDS